MSMVTEEEVTKAREIADGLRELGLEDLDHILGKTIFGDETVKKILFLICLLTYTDREQENAIETGETTIGKTYNITEVLWFFPREDIQKFEGATPKSFIHDSSAIQVDARTMQPIDWSKAPQKGDDKEKWDEWNDIRRNSAYFIDLSKKILVFPDMPDTGLLKVLRSVLSHDGKRSIYSIAEKTKSGIRTKKVIIEGFFTCLFCTASTELDEQEASRFFLLTPSDDKEKIKRSLDLINRKNSDPCFREWYETEPERYALRTRVSNVKAEDIQEIYIPEGLMANLKDWFILKTRSLSVKSQRDFPRVISIAKACAMLNWKHRDRQDKVLWCNERDIEVAKQLYEPILQCNEYGLTPEEWEIWKTIKPHVEIGLSISEIHNLYFQSKNRPCSDKRLRGMLKNLCRAGLLREEKDGNKLKYYSVLESSDK